jgi:hypothetical protein
MMHFIDLGIHPIQIKQRMSQLNFLKTAAVAAFAKKKEKIC